MRYVKPHYWDDPDYERIDLDCTDHLSDDELEQLRRNHEDWEVEQALDKLNDKEY
jgi:hypothetical protein